MHTLSHVRSCSCWQPRGGELLILNPCSTRCGCRRDKARESFKIKRLPFSTCSDEACLEVASSAVLFRPFLFFCLFSWLSHTSLYFRFLSLLSRPLNPRRTLSTGLVTLPSSIIRHTILLLYLLAPAVYHN